MKLRKVPVLLPINFQSNNKSTDNVRLLRVSMNILILSHSTVHTLRHCESRICCKYHGYFICYYQHRHIQKQKLSVYQSTILAASLWRQNKFLAESLLRLRSKHAVGDRHNADDPVKMDPETPIKKRTLLITLSLICWLE